MGQISADQVAAGIGVTVLVIGGVLVCIAACPAIAAGAGAAGAALAAGQGLVAAGTILCIRACTAIGSVATYGTDVACGCLIGGDVPAAAGGAAGVRRAAPQAGAIVYPPNRGFAGVPVTVTLMPGLLIDRYGRRGGTFASPAGTSIETRSLPPSSSGAPHETYRVVRPIEGVGAGPAAPWFDQPGGGMQYELPSSVADLIRAGMLEVVD